MFVPCFSLTQVTVDIDSHRLLYDVLKKSPILLYNSIFRSFPNKFIDVNVSDSKSENTSVPL